MKEIHLKIEPKESFSEMVRTGLAELNGMPVQKASNMDAETIQGEKPNIAIFKGGQSLGNVFATSEVN